MGVDTKKLRNRIKSVDSTLHLTTAMGLVASSKIRRAMEAMSKSGEYSKMIENVIQNLADCRECSQSPYIDKKDEEKVCIIVIAGDRGLAGGYNSNVFRLSRQYPQAEFVAIGKRACDIYGGEYSAEHFSFEQASALSKKLCERFTNGEITRLGIISTEYISMMSQEARIDWILPLEKSQEKTDITGIIFEPDQLSVLNTAVPLYVTGRIKNLIILSNGENISPEELEKKFADEKVIKEIIVCAENNRIIAEVFPDEEYAKAAGIENIEEYLQEKVRLANKGEKSYREIAALRLRTTPFPKTTTGKIKRNHIKY